MKYAKAAYTISFNNGAPKARGTRAIAMATSRGAAIRETRPGGGLIFAGEFAIAR